MNTNELVTFDEWRQQHPERWARAEGTITHAQLRNLKYLDAQIHLTRERELGTTAPETAEVKWLRTCVAIYLHVMAYGIFPSDEQSVMWVKNQRRAALCDYQVASLMQIPNWKWHPRRTSWDHRVAELNSFREEFGREPRVRSVWEHERALAHWYSRQRKAAKEGKLTPNQMSLLEGEAGQPTGEVLPIAPVMTGVAGEWFRDFWTGSLGNHPE